MKAFITLHIFRIGAKSQNMSFVNTGGHHEDEKNERPEVNILQRMYYCA